MEGKKRYIAIVLFLLIGLTLFAFANPAEEEKGSKKKNGNGDETQEVSKDENTNDGILETEGEENNQASVQYQLAKVEDNSYTNALEAVEQAESSFAESDIESAKELIEQVTNEEQKKELNDRIDILEEALDVMALVEELEEKLEESENRDDIEDTTDFRDEEEVEDKVESLRNEEVKTALKEKLAKINRVLNDNEAPKYSGVEDDETTKEDVTITIEDETDIEVKVTLDGEEKEYKENEPFTEEGVYEVVLVDEAFNETKITFTIDKTAPTVTIETSNKGNSTKDDVTVTLKTDEYVTTPEGWTEVVEGYEFTRVYSENGKYTVSVKDLAGNETTKKFEVKRIDKVAPTAVVTKSNNDEFTKEDVTVTLVANEAIYKPAGWTEVKTNKEHEFTKVYSENGTYEVVIKDKAGNETTITFEVKNIDRIAPNVTIETSNKGNSTKDNVTVTLKTDEYVTTPEGWTEVVEGYEFTRVYSENGKYTVSVKDLAGNETTKKFEVKRIDKVAPTAVVTKSNNDEFTKEDVTVTLVANEAIYKPAGWTEVKTNKEHEFTKVYSENGTYEVVIKDKAGNETTITFEVKNIDRTPATITVSEGTIGKNPYSKLNLKMYDANGVASVVINGEQLSHKGQYVDINDGDAYTFKEGENIVEVTDVAGNKTTATFLIDRTPGTITVSSTVGKAPHYSEMSFKLYDANKIDKFFVNGVEFDRTDAVWSDANFCNTKGAVKNGENTIVLYDVAGNATELKFTLDLVAPVISIKDGSIGNDPYFSNVSFNFSDNNLVDKYVINEKEVDFGDNKYSNANYNNFKSYLKSGENTITLYDTAGNSTTKKFIMDWTAPVATEHSLVGNAPHFSQISFKLYDNNMIDKFFINGVEFDRTNAQWSDANYDNIKSALVDGENEIILYDIAGNPFKKNFNLDLVKPEAVLVTQQYEEQDGGRIKVSVQFSEPLQETLGQGWYKDTTKENTYTKRYYKTQDVTINFADLAGNKNSYLIKVDKTAPNVISIMQELDIKGNKRRTKVTLTFDEPLRTSLGQGWLKLSDTQYVKYYENAKEHTVTFSDTIGNPGVYTFVTERL